MATTEPATEKRPVASWRRPDDPLLDGAAIADASRRLGDRLAHRGVVADLSVFGGAAMALAHDARRSTRDIDAVFQPHGVVLDEAKAVELGLPQWWLNEQASAYASPCGDTNAPRVFDHPGLRVVGSLPRPPPGDEGPAPSSRSRSRACRSWLRGCWSGRCGS